MHNKVSSEYYLMVHKSRVTKFSSQGKLLSYFLFCLLTVRNWEECIPIPAFLKASGPTEMSKWANSRQRLLAVRMSKMQLLLQNWGQRIKNWILIRVTRSVFIFLSARMGLQICGAVYSTRRFQKYRRNILLPSSGFMSRRAVMFITTAVRTPNQILVYSLSFEAYGLLGS
jgi:hypothetical protein